MNSGRVHANVSSINHAVTLIQLTALFILFVFIIVLPFYDTGNLFKSYQTEKFFLFDGVLGILMILQSLRLFFTPNSCFDFKITLPDLFLFIFVVYLSLNRYFISHMEGFTLKYYQLVALSIFYIILRSTPLNHQKYLIPAILISGIVQAIYGNLQLYDIYPSKHYLFNITGGFFNPGPYGGYLAMIFPMALTICLYNIKQKTLSRQTKNSGTIFKDEFKLILEQSKTIPKSHETILKQLKVIQKQIKTVLKKSAEILKRPETIKEIKSRIIQYISLITIITILLVLPATRSRAAWLAAVISSVFVLITVYPGRDIINKYLKTKTKKVLVFTTVILLVSGFVTGIYYMKKDSADGRLLIWKVTTRMIKDRPLLGHGYEKFQADYMSYQAAYFNRDPESEESYVADNIIYPFNEYLKLFGESGLSGFILIMILMVMLFISKNPEKNKSNLYALLSCAGIVSLSIFAFFSYPSEILPILINLVILSAIIAGQRNSSGKEISRIYTDKIRIVGIVARFTLAVFTIMIAVIALKPFEKLYTAYEKWDEGYNIYLIGAYDESIESFEESYQYLKNNGEFLVMYGKALSMAGRHQQAVRTLFEAQDYLQNTILYTALGDSYKQLGEAEYAERAYLHAWHMNPSSFYPKYLLAKLYDETGQNEKAVKTANELLNKKVKIYSTAIDEIRGEMEMIIMYDTLK